VLLALYVHGEMLNKRPTISLDETNHEKSISTCPEWIERDNSIFLVEESDPFPLLRSFFTEKNIGLIDLAWVFQLRLDGNHEGYTFVTRDLTVWDIQIESETNKIVKSFETQYDKLSKGEYIEYVQPAKEYFESKDI